MDNEPLTLKDFPAIISTAVLVIFSVFLFNLLPSPFREIVIGMMIVMWFISFSAGLRAKDNEIEREIKRKERE